MGRGPRPPRAAGRSRCWPRPNHDWPRRFFRRAARVNADELMSAIVAKRLVEHLERSGFIVMKKPPIGGAAALGRGHER